MNLPFIHEVRKKARIQFLPAWYAFRSRRDLSVFLEVVRNKINYHYSPGTNLEHIREAMGWLCRAQDATPDNGVSGNYDVVANRWYPSYPETTGYIIPTFFDYAAFSKDDTFFQRATAMGNWLLSLQLENGAFPGPPWIEPKGEPIIFDTGQIIHGLVRAYEETKEPVFMDAACRAGDWLVEVQDEDGCWRKFDMDTDHVYNTRTAWALLRIHQINPCDRYYFGARKNLDWAVRQQTRDGWFAHAGFELNEDPLTHTLAYTIEGLFESGMIIGVDEYIQSAQKAADALLECQEQNGSLRGKYGKEWKPASDWSCLTGNVQMAIIWFQLYKRTKNERYLQAALAANRYVKKLHSRSSKSPGIRGGVAGSFPIYGEYGHYLYVNWAAKFFTDSLLLEQQVMADNGLS